MKYFASLFAVIAFSFWFPIFLAVVDMYHWYWFDHNLTGFEYGASGRPLLLILFFFLGVASLAASATLFDLSDKK